MNSKGSITKAEERTILSVMAQFALSGTIALSGSSHGNLAIIVCPLPTIQAREIHAMCPSSKNAQSIKNSKGLCATTSSAHPGVLNWILKQSLPKGETFTIPNVMPIKEACM